MENYNFYLVQDRDKLNTECNVIKLLKTDIADEKDIVSSYKKGLLDFSNSITVKRTDTSEPFNISLLKSVTDTYSFNLVLFFYYDEDDSNTVFLALAKFANVLEYDKNVTISLTTEFSYSTGSNSVIYTTKLTQDDKSRIGTESYNYTSLEEVKKVTISDFSKLCNYTTSVEDSIKNGSVIFNGLFNSRFGKLNHLDFSTGFKMIDANEKGFDYYFISVYRDDIALYAWRFNSDNNIELRIVSLSRQNLFGQPALFTRKNGGYAILDCKDYKPSSVRYCAGKYLVINCKNNKYIVFNIETNTVVGESSETDNYIIDSYDNTAKIVMEDLLLNYPEINELQEKVEFVGNVYIKCGNWVISKTDSNRLCCQSHYLNKTVDTGSKYFLINEQTLLAYKDNTWILYQGEKEYSFTDLSDIYNTDLRYFRRNKLCTSGIVDIIGAYKGIIYYIDKENKINIL
jgi:hypothetical protein